MHSFTKDIILINNRIKGTKFTGCDARVSSVSTIDNFFEAWLCHNYLN